MLSKKGYENLIARIFETGGLTDAMEADLKKLKDELDEREVILRKYGEPYDGEDDEYEYRERNDRDYKTEYEALKERYIRRFMSGKETDEENIVEVLEEGEPKKREFKDLFKREDNE